MLTFPIIWDISFSSFQMFVGVGIIWMLFIEPRIPSRSLSVTLMVIVAVAAAALNFYVGVSKVRREWQVAQEQITASESAAVEYEGEIV
jgi:ABC-type siderophore export system fused ATPase/permease subunit